MPPKQQAAASPAEPTITLTDSTSGPAASTAAALQPVEDKLRQAAPAPASSSTPAEPPARHAPEVWATLKQVQPWALAATRARFLASPGHPLRVGFLENGELTEAQFDEALNTTLNGELR